MYQRYLGMSPNYTTFQPSHSTHNSHNFHNFHPFL